MRDFPPVFFTVMIGFWHRSGVSDQERAGEQRERRAFKKKLGV